MKELSIEGKAKLYDEAIERVNKLKNTCDAPAVIGWCKYIFPELKESDDERIREKLIELFHDTVSNDEMFSDYGLEKTEVLDWLEKQGEQNLTWGEEQIKVCQEVYADILSAKGFDLATINSELKRLKEQFKSAILHKKQGEQKPVDKIEPKFHEGDWITIKE